MVRSTRTSPFESAAGRSRGGTRRVDSTGNRRRKMRLTRAEGRLIISKDASAASGDGCIWRISLVGLCYVSIG